MNRIVSGSVALAAAAVLCLGGAGSMASWQASAASADAVTFTMGTLELATTPGTWTLDGAAVTDASRPVPGSALSYTQTVTLTLAGDDLAARITLDPGAVSTGAFVPGAVTLSAPAVADGDGWIVRESGALTLTMAFSWPKGTVVDNAVQGTQITIDASELLVVQEVAP